jgi:carnitine-CoA ligase
MSSRSTTVEPAPDPIPLVGGNLAGLVRWAASEFGSKSALEIENGESFTFVELASRTAGFVSQLAAAGVVAGDRIAVALDNRSTFPLLIIAAAQLGASVLPLNPGYVALELANVCELVQPTHVVALPGFCESHRRLLEKLGVPVFPVDVQLPWTSAQFTDRDEPFDGLGGAFHLDDKIRFGLTSGSTGVPKAVTKSQRQWLLDGRAVRSAMGITADDRVMSSQPLYYGDPFMLLMACLQAGATTVYLSRFRSQTFMENVATRRITKFMSIGSMPAMLLNTPPGPYDRNHSAQAAWSVAVPRHLHADLEDRFGIRWLELYGTSECGGALAQTLSDEPTVGEGWLGRTLPGQEVRLIDEGGAEVAGDGTGMLEVRGPTVCTEYWRRPDATKEAFMPGGWYRTGDIMERSSSRYRYLYRQKDIVRRAGENISCQEVEAAIRRHPRVVDVAVRARPDDIRGEEVWAFVQLVEPRPDEDLERCAESVALKASESLSRHKVPRFVSFVESLPRTPTERIAKRLLPAMEEVPSFDLGERRARHGG